VLSDLPIVFLLDVDNTLLDNDRFAQDLGARLRQSLGEDACTRYWTFYNELRDEHGYADYLGALQCMREEFEERTELLSLEGFLLDYPFAELLYPGAFAAIAHLASIGLPVVLSDGDLVFQPRKVKRSGIWNAVGGRVVIRLHKERAIASLERRFPASHYVMVDDKTRLLAAMKRGMGARLTTVFVRQGHYAHEPMPVPIDPVPELTIERIGELINFDASALPSAAPPEHSVAAPQPTPFGAGMNKTQYLRDLGQSLWLDNITRTLLDDGTLHRYVDEFSITGLTSNPTIFDEAIGKSDAYDESIRLATAKGTSGEVLFTELALDDLRRAADLFRPIFEATDHGDGWVSMEVSPLLAADTAGTIKAASHIHKLADRPNLFVKIPGTPDGLPAIEESIFRGVPINVTLLFSREQYLASANAYLRGIERRIAAGLDARVASVASLFISRWDKAVNDTVDDGLRNRLGIAVGQRTYCAYRDLLSSDRWRRLASAGARPQRLLWASTGAKDPKVSQTLYVEALAAADTINTMPEKTLLAYAERGATRGALAADGGDCESVLARFAESGIAIDALALQLQHEGVASFMASWKELLGRLEQKSAQSTQRTTPEPHDA
jgi:transaldolase